MNKEPWQMSRDEWWQEWESLQINFSGCGGSRISCRATTADGYARHRKPIEDRQNWLKMGIQDQLLDGLQIPARHRQVIEHALSVGLPVPPEIVDEYR